MKTVQSQIAWCAKAQWSMTIIMCSLIVGFLIFGFRPNNQRRNALRSEIANKVSLLETNQARAQGLTTLAIEVDRLRVKLERFNKQLPKTPGLGEFINDTAQVSNQFAVKKLMHQPGMLKRMDLYGEIPIVMSFEGEFSNVFSFVRRLEEMPRLTRVKSLSVRCKDGKSGQVDVNLAMNIYFSEL
jgi:Tfp pilus assembly protein PilO